MKNLVVGVCVALILFAAAGLFRTLQRDIKNEKADRELCRQAVAHAVCLAPEQKLVILKHCMEPSR